MYEVHIHIVFMRVPAVGYSVERGSIIAKENNYNLIEYET
jgi:hypothetical protein